MGSSNQGGVYSGRMYNRKTTEKTGSEYVACCFHHGGQMDGRLRARARREFVSVSFQCCFVCWHRRARPKRMPGCHFRFKSIISHDEHRKTVSFCCCCHHDDATSCPPPTATTTARVLFQAARNSSVVYLPSQAPRGGTQRALFIA